MSDVAYSRWRFATTLPEGLLYTARHGWLRREAEGVWRVGLTGFALWLLGDVVEYGFGALPGQRVDGGVEVGWVEGLKAVETLATPVAGEFLGENDAVAGDVTLLQHDPYRSGWLYRVRGTPAPGTLDAAAYAVLLDPAVDAVRAAREAECEGECDA